MEDPLDSAAVEHEVSVNALPKSAFISVDGVALSNPAHRTCKHGQAFLVHITAPGHVPRDREVRCEYDEHLDITLAATAQTIVINQPPSLAGHPASKVESADVAKPSPSGAPGAPTRHAAPLDTNPFR